MMFTAARPGPIGAWLSLLFVLVAVTGCGARVPLVSTSAGTMRVESLGETPVALTGRLKTSLYSDESSVETTFILADVPLDRVIRGDVDRGQIVHLEMLWLPRPGWTPRSADATNASIRYIVISDGEVGIYAGAGFASPSGSIGRKNLTVTLHDASLKLIEHTPGFVDLLTPAKLSGTFVANYEPRKTRQAHYAMSQIVTDALGRSMFIRADDPLPQQLAQSK